MHQTVTALVLREVKYKEGDKILTLLSPELGKLTATARGARRKNSQLAAGTQMLCWGEFVLYEFQGRIQVKECSPIRQFTGLQLDLERFSLACYCAEVTELLAVEGMAAGELLPLMLNTLHALEKMEDKPLSLIKAAFELRAMCISGYEPQLEGCEVCGGEPEEPRFHLREGALHCASCRPQMGEGISMPLSPKGVEGMRYIAWCNPKRLFGFSLEGDGLRQLGDIAEGYLLTQLERGFHTLDYYKSISLEGISP